MRRDNAKKLWRWAKTLPKEKILAITVFIMIVAVAVIGALNIHLIPAFNLVLLAGLIAVTTIYAYSTIQIARDTKRQADEIREQRVMATRPVIIQRVKLRSKEEEGKIRPIGSSYCLSHFEIYNAGNGPAVELEISVLNNSKARMYSKRETFFSPHDPPIEFHLSQRARREETTCYLICEYQSIYSRGKHQTWYQTWLPFKPIKSSLEGEIYVEPGELEFHEVSEKDRIDAFRGMHKLEGVYKLEND